MISNSSNQTNQAGVPECLEGGGAGGRGFKPLSAALAPVVLALLVLAGCSASAPSTVHRGGRALKTAQPAAQAPVQQTATQPAGALPQDSTEDEDIAEGPVSLPPMGWQPAEARGQGYAEPAVGKEGVTVPATLLGAVDPTPRQEGKDGDGLDLSPVRPWLEGMASWYGPDFHGKPTANGETYDQYGFTAAHPMLPLGTRVRVVNQVNGRVVEVRVNDRGPYAKGRVIDLSLAAARRLGMVGGGTTPVRIQVTAWPPGLDRRLGLRAYTQFVVQVAGAADPDAARVKMANAQARAGNTRLWLDNPPGGNYSVVHGPFNSPDEAQRAAARLKAQGLTTLVRSWRK
ncbi:MAG: septal ring lytic transglycosylase RlpA family protein [Deltaproteobacteria bacterium]|nr:septal ring lytic transglycosylase RlpA family protein [Deltaproteobacteria bacterium]MDH4122072.1 septal ring lytic transglycosylase RlpA family protein [Deltaproteobacteria bacterium]